MSKRRPPSPFENESLQDLVSYAHGRPDGTVDLDLSGITWDDDRAAYDITAPIMAMVRSPQFSQRAKGDHDTTNAVMRLMSGLHFDKDS